MKQNKLTLIHGHIGYWSTEENKIIYEHRELCEKLNNITLKENQDVHHLDCNTVNNNPENLIYLDSSQHTKLHNWIRRGCPIKNIKCDTIEEALKYSRRCRNINCTNILRYKNVEFCSIKCRDEYFKKTCLVRNKNNNYGKSATTWPDVDYLVKKVNEIGYTQLGKEIGVSDNAIKKRIKKLGKFNEVTRSLKSNGGSNSNKKNK